MQSTKFVKNIFVLIAKYPEQIYCSEHEQTIDLVRYLMVIVIDSDKNRLQFLKYLVINNVLFCILQFAILTFDDS